MIFDTYYDLKNEDETLCLAKKMANFLHPGMHLYLKGELGAGKTSYVRGLLRGLGYEDKVKSPTYTLLESYTFKKFTVYHFDLYRFKDPSEWEDAGFRELVNNHSVCFIEWPEKAGGILPQPDIAITLTHAPFGRKIHLMAYTIKGMECLKNII